MSAYAKEHSIRIHFEELEGMGAADYAIEVDYLLRSVDRLLEGEARYGKWRWC